MMTRPRCGSRRAVMVIAAAATFAAWAGAAVAQPAGPGGNLPLAPLEIERRMEREPFAITSVDDAGGGVMGAKKVRLAFDDGTSFDAKWKESATGGEGWNNAPRREIAAYRLQQLYLDPDDYLVPPVVTRCIPFDAYRPVASKPEATFAGTRCVFGTLSAWLQNVTEPARAFDRERFSSDRRYAYHFANLNLLTYLADHRDARRNNFLMSKDAANPQVFSIDNGIAFGGVLYNFFTWHFDQLRVGGLPRRSIARLRQITHGDWERLAVVAQLRVDAQGILQPEALTAPLNPNEGNRRTAAGLQIGLTAAEIDAVMQRANALLLEVDRGAIALF